LWRPPRAQFLEPPTEVSEGSVRLRLQVDSPTRVAAVRTFTEGRPSSTSVAVCASSREIEVRVDLIPGHNLVTAVAIDDRGAQSNPARAVIHRLDAPSPRLWSVSIGVGIYPEAPQLNLPLAARDARRVSAVIAEQGAKAGFAVTPIALPEDA